MSKFHATMGILALMIGLLLINALFSCRENFIEGLEGMTPDVSGGLVNALPAGGAVASTIATTAALPTTATDIMNKVSTAVSDASGNANSTVPAASTTESFENIFQNHYSSASHSGSNNFFKNVPFRPECCNTSSYSTSTGCACLSEDKIRFLRHHGNND